MEKEKRQDSRKRWLLIFILCTFVGLFSFSTVHTTHLVEGEEIPFYYPLMFEMTGAYAAFILLPALLWFFARFPITRHNIVKTVPIYILISMLYGVCHTLLMIYSRKIIYAIFLASSYKSGAIGYRFLMEYHKQAVIFVLV
ncbi:MAG: hypothetical protein AB1489_30745, partial [Acidobacteriota bacterium]